MILNDGYVVIPKADSTQLALSYIYINLLVERSLNVIPHPDLPSVSTHPEFEINHKLCNFYVEATLALESEDFQAQEQRLRELYGRADLLRKQGRNL